MPREQLRLQGLEPLRTIRPVSNTSPGLWVRRLVVVSELDDDPNHVVREVRFRRGLNIVWTPPHATEGTASLFSSGLAGHTAGKSTLCRFIRYILGEATFGGERLRKRIREQFSRGWVLGEVEVSGTSWAVARPLAVGPHPFCIEDGTIASITDGTPRSEYGSFVDQIAQTVVAALPVGEFPGSEAKVRWEHLLPWLTRDQECRFADFLDWRHPASEAEAPFLKVDERQFLVRAVLALVSADERRELLRNAQLVEEKRQADRLLPILVDRAERDGIRLRSVLRVGGGVETTQLFGSPARQELERLSADVERRLEELARTDPRPGLQRALEDAISTEANARRDVGDTKARIQSHSWSAAALSPTTSDTKSLLAGLPPPRDYCAVPLTLARTSGCPLAVPVPVDLTAHRSERLIPQEIDREKTIVASLEVLAREKEEALAASVIATTAARRALFEAASAFEREKDALVTERNRLLHATSAVSDAEAASEASRKLEARLQELDREMDRSYARQEDLRQRSNTALGHFSATFDYVMRALLGDEVRGIVDTSGRTLRLVVEHLGERESTAIETLKLLAFDLAAMTESIQGRGKFPRFVLHDGPREADMAADIYGRLFAYGGELERCFEGEPDFQYIITTTTPPPDAFMELPWLRLVLAGLPAEERLLRCDL